MIVLEGEKICITFAWTGTLR